MGVYTYKISRKSRKVDDIPTGQDCVYLAEFGYKLGYYEDDAVMHRKYVAPTVRAWDKYFLKNFPMTAADIYFVMDFEDGAEIYKRNNVDWIDGGVPGRVVGHLALDGHTGRMRFMEPKMEEYIATFESYEHTGRANMQITVRGACEFGARLSAQETFRSDVQNGNFYKQMPTMEKAA